MTVANFTPVSGLIGGALIGLAALLLLAANGRIAGISGIFGNFLFGGRNGERLWRGLFLVGLVVGAATYWALRPQAAALSLEASWPGMAVAGVLVGFGTRLGSGCTSGHGVCGIGRLSPRSMVATATFVLLGFITVFLLRHVLRISP
jgi:uncharacterized membrane protein YedE/YeeE